MFKYPKKIFSGLKYLEFKSQELESLEFDWLEFKWAENETPEFESAEFSWPKFKTSRKWDFAKIQGDTQGAQWEAE